MRTIFTKFCFCYGVLISALGLALMMGWSAVGTKDQEIVIAVPLLIGYALTAIFTFPVYRVRSEWESLFEVSSIRKKDSHFIVWLSIFIFGTFLLITLLARLISGPVSSSLVLRLIGSFLWLNGVYFVIHWAFRPENIFARSTLILLNNLPFAIFSSRYRRNAARPDERITWNKHCPKKTECLCLCFELWDEAEHRQWVEQARNRDESR